MPLQETSKNYRNISIELLCPSSSISSSVDFSSEFKWIVIITIKSAIVLLLSKAGSSQ